MIFVILGLVILFTSFIVALVSLLREQREVGERGLEDRGLSGEQVPEEVSRPTEQISQPVEEFQGVVEPAKQVEPKEQVIPEAQIEEVFPWEQKGPDSVVVTQKAQPAQSVPKSHLEGVIVIPRKGGV